MSGYFAVDRGIFENGFFAAEPFSEREAWLWLIAEAAWKEKRVRRGSTTLDLARGELAHALDFMRKAWKWKTKSRVSRFLKRLESGEKITLKTGRDTTRITICNYDIYQSGRDAKRDAGETPTRRARDELEELNQRTIEPKIKRASRADIPREKTPREELEVVLDLGRSQAVVDHRSRLRKPLTPHAARLLAARFAAWSDPNEGADAMIANGWQGFDPAWMANRSRGQGPPGKRTIVDAGIDWLAEDENGKTGENSNHNVVKLIPATRGQP